MNVKITSVHFDADIKLKDFISAKITKLTQFHDGIIGAEVFLRLANKNDKEDKIAEIKLDIPGNDLFAEKVSKSFEESVDMAVEALRKQLLKVKEKSRK